MMTYWKYTYWHNMWHTSDSISRPICRRWLQSVIIIAGMIWQKKTRITCRGLRLRNASGMIYTDTHCILCITVFQYHIATEKNWCGVVIGGGGGEVQCTCHMLSLIVERVALYILTTCDVTMSKKWPCFMSLSLKYHVTCHYRFPCRCVHFKGS